MKRPSRGAGRRSNAGTATRAAAITASRSTSITASSSAAGISHSGTPPAITLRRGHERVEPAGSVAGARDRVAQHGIARHVAGEVSTRSCASAQLLHAGEFVRQSLVVGGAVDGDDGPPGAHELVHIAAPIPARRL
jgi:hypothetical protein